MLRIYPVVLRTIEGLRRTLGILDHKDRDLSRQLRRCSASCALNLGEGQYSRGKNRAAKYHIALGSARARRARLCLLNRAFVASDTRRCREDHGGHTMDTRQTRRLAGLLSSRLPDARLDRLEDPRHSRGRRWSLPMLLSGVLCCMASGATSLADVERLSGQLSPAMRKQLGSAGVSRTPLCATCSANSTRSK
ncbi:MAG: four helix bundle protein [Polyangiaceae bacterium]|nr:four helix bundle protein [Polyangiaceae bacterium]